MSAPAHLPPFDAGPTIGALLVGSLCSFILYGITVVQIYMYYGRFPDDIFSLKATVVGIGLFETAHVVCVGHALYYFAVDNYGNPLALLSKAPISLAVSIVVGAILTVMVQGFFAYRIWTLSPNMVWKVVPIFLWASCLVYLLASSADTGLSIQAPSIPAFIKAHGWLLLAPWIIALLNDNIITISLVILLLMSRKRGFNKTTALVDHLIKWSIETGLITSLFSILNLAFYEKETNNFVWVGIQVVKVRLAANSLLASLNSRDTLRKLNATTAAQLDSNGATSRAAYTTNHGQQPLNIAMTKVTLRETDAEAPAFGGNNYGYKE